jgi:hypothetical protein
MFGTQNPAVHLAEAARVLGMRPRADLPAFPGVEREIAVRARFQMLRAHRREP